MGAIPADKSSGILIKLISNIILIRVSFTHVFLHQLSIVTYKLCLLCRNRDDGRPVDGRV